MLTFKLLLYDKIYVLTIKTWKFYNKTDIKVLDTFWENRILMNCSQPLNEFLFYFVAYCVQIQQWRYVALSS